jgi:uncharacterized membrane protein
MRQAVLFGAALVALCGATFSSAAEPSFRGLGAWPSGDGVVWPRAISADGGTIVAIVPSQQKSLRWTASGGYEELTDPGASSPLAQFRVSDVSPDGKFAYGGTSRPRPGGGAIARVHEDGAVDYPVEFPSTGPGFNLADFRANDDGSAFAMTVESGTDDLAARWSVADGLQVIGDFIGGLNDSRSTGISSDGSVVVGIGTDFGGDRAFRWTAEGGLQHLDGIGGSTYIASGATAVSADGSVIVGKAKSGLNAQDQYAMRWTEAGGVEPLTLLGDSTPLKGYAFDVSADGERIVGSADGIGAFIWTETTGAVSIESLLRDRYGLDDELEGWTLSGADLISADGRTISSLYGWHPGGPPSAAWVATIPEPSSVALALICAAGLLASRQFAGKRQARS